MKKKLITIWRSLHLKIRIIIIINLTILTAMAIISAFAIINRVNTQYNEVSERIETEMENIHAIINSSNGLQDSVELKKFLLKKTIYNNGYVWLVNENGNILLNDKDKFNIANKPFYKEIFKNKEGFVDAIDEETKKDTRIYYKYHEKYKIYTLITLFNEEYLSKPVYNTAKILIFATIFSLIILSIVNYLAIGTIVKPLKNLGTNIDKISKGQNPEKIIYKKSDEIGNIVESVNILNEGLISTANFAKEIEKGNFNANYTPLSKSDILGNALLDMRLSLQKAAEDEKLRKIEDEKRNWTAQGLAVFADLLRKNNDNLEVLSYNVIYNLVKYIQASLGGIFILNDEDKSDVHLQLLGCYAYDRQKFLEKRINIGEGLVGTCYLEKKSIYLTNVPDKYISITSGLGDARPRVILVVPLLINDQIFGIMELASFKTFDKYIIEFVEKIAESIASTISSVKINVKTAFLLEQSQMQGEQMKAQEEEMRQNLEELHATQEAMSEKARHQSEENELLKAQFQESISKLKEENIELKEKIHNLELIETSLNTQISELNNNKEVFIAKENANKDEIEKLNTDIQTLTEKIQTQEDSLHQYIEQINNFKEEEIKKDSEFQGFLNAIDNSIATAEFDLRGNIINVNENYTNIIGLTKKELLHKNYIDLFVKENAASSEFILFFENLSKGLVQSGESMHKFSRGEVWLHETYTPVKNLKGEVYKVISFIFDITERKKTESIQNVLFSILSNINYSESLEDLFYLIHTNLTQVINAKNFSVGLIDVANNQISYPYFVDEKVSQTPENHPFRKGLIEYVYKTKKAALVTPRRWQELTLLGEIEREGTPPVDWLGVPLIYENNILGVIVVQSYNDKIRIKENDKNFLLFIAEQISHAVKRRLNDYFNLNRLDDTQTKLNDLSEKIEDDQLLLEDNNDVEKNNDIIEEKNNASDEISNTENKEETDEQSYNQDAWNEHLDASGKLFKKKPKKK